MKKRAVGYIRVSKEEQGEGWSLDGQEQQIREFAERSGYEIVDIFRDESSGTKDRRPGFDHMLDDAQRGQFEAIILVHTSRLFRNIGLARRYKDELRNRLGVEVLFANQPIMDASDPMAFIMEGINELFDEYYIHQLRFWTKLGKHTRARRGLWNGTLPFGYITDGNGVPIPHPENAEGLCSAFEAYSTGRFSDREIAEILNRSGYRTSGNWGKRRFTKDTVNRLLKNEFYLGFTKYKGELIEGKHEALIEIELFEKCKVVRASRRNRPRAIGGKKRVYILSGLARCVECGLTLRCQSTQSGGKWRYYRHAAQVRGYDCSVPGKMIRADKLEKQWSEIVSRIQLPNDWRRRIEDLAGDADQREAILNEKAETEEKLRRLATLYQDMLIDDGTYRLSRDNLQQRLSMLIIPESTKLIAAARYLETLAQMWNAASLEEKRDITRILLGAIYIDVEAGKVTSINPNEVFNHLLTETCTSTKVNIL